MLGVGLLLAIGGGAAGQPVDSGASVRSAADDSAVLLSARTSAGDRASAARRLLGNPSAQARATVEQVLLGGEPGASDEVRTVLLREIAVWPSPPPWVVPPLAQMLSAPALPAETRLEAIAAASAVRTRDAVRLLLDQAGTVSGSAQEIRDAAFAGLARLSGHAEFGADLNRWQVWFGQVQWISEAEWRRELAETLGGRVDALVHERDQFAARLADALRQQYVGIEAIADRSARLVAFLQDAQPEIRRLGLELAQQEIANARQLDPAVGVAAVELLSDGSAATRKRAAEVVNIIVPTEQSGRVAEALRRETDPEIAALLLKAIARWPMRDLTPMLVTWLEAGPPAAAPACDAIDAIDRQGWMVDQAMRSRTLGALQAWRGRELDRLPPSALRLLFVLGSEEDRRGVLAMLHDSEGPRRWAAATAVAPVRDALDALLEAAHSDSAMFPLVAQAVTAFRPSADGFLALAEVPAADPAQRRERLLALSQELSHSELTRAARATKDPSLREAMLTRLLREPLASQRVPGSERTFKPEVIAGILTLCRTRMELGQPAGALAALDALGGAADQVNPAYLNELRVRLLLWLNRLDEASKVEVGPEVWLEGLDLCVTLEHAPKVADAIEARFAGRLSADDTAKLAVMRSRIGLDRSVVP